MNTSHFRTLFIDIETTSGTHHWEDLDARLQDLWKKKGKKFLGQDERNDLDQVDWAQLYKDKAAILAEFGKIVCISVGLLVQMEGKELGMRIKSFYGDDERKILEDFTTMITESFQNQSVRAICGHNIREFDIPYICRRMLIQGMPLPPALQFQGKKPWELEYLVDTLNLWKFGDYKNYTSLDLLAAVFNIPSPKDDIDGSQVSRVYWEDQGIERIKTYCEKDIWVTACVYLKMKHLPLPLEEHIVHI